MSIKQEPENGYYVAVREIETGNPAKISGPYKSIQEADLAANNWNTNMHYNFYAIGAWFGPDTEPQEQQL